jgi:short subunit dehydrogenase-like uncharacterized protein
MHLHERMPEATHLTLAIHSLGGGLSRGTALTGIEGISKQGLIRRDGKLVQIPLFLKDLQVDFGNGPRTVVSFPWADVCTAYYSTGIPNIEEFMAYKRSYVRLARLFRPFIGLAGKPFVQSWLKERIMKSPPGPSAEKRQQGRSRLWGEASDYQGNRVASRLETPEAYTFTAVTALGAVKHVLDRNFKAGFQTPSLAFGADFILEFDGVKREDII